VARSVVAIGSSATKGTVAFSYVEQAFCIKGKPTCPAAGGIAGFESTGVYGILGIGMQSSPGGVVSPILGMPASTGTRWSLHLSGHSGSLVLGAPLPGHRSSTLVRLAPIGNSTGSALWADSRVPLCVTAGTARGCVPGLFDSGTYSMQISGPGLDQTPTTPGTDQVASGTPVAVTLPGARSPFWTFTAGATKSADLVTVKMGRGPFVNTGVQAFYDFTVTYDDARGTIQLSR